MATDPTKRVENWNTKYNLERVNAILTEKRPKMLEHVGSVFPSLYEMETSVRQQIDAAGVTIIQYPFYLSFGRELWALQDKGVSGESLAIEAATLIGKWVDRGLSQSVLEAIRTQVFNVSAPVVP